jgi:PEP-CTERM motif
MRRLNHTRLAPAAVVLLAWLSSFAPQASAAPIELGNDADVSWQNNPNCILNPALCEPLVFGAPRVVPDMSDAGALLLFELDFLDVSVTNFRNGFFFQSFVGLNIADAQGNEVFGPGGSIPLQLTYAVPTSQSNFPNGAGFLPADDITVNLANFNGFGLLPPGDLLFTVTLDLALDLPLGQTFDGSNSSRTEVARLTVSGPGTVVPEPSTIVLLLVGLGSTGLGIRWRRSTPRLNHAVSESGRRKIALSDSN